MHSSELRVGMHVQGFSNGGSESFVSVPEPPMCALLFSGLLFLGFALRRAKT